MARTGISYQSVVQAAEQLTAEGKNATIENVRFITGTGSSTTIAMHLRTWRGYSSQTKALSSEDTLPEAIVSVMKGLWTHVIQEAHDQVEPIKQRLEQALSELDLKQQKLQEEYANLQLQYQQLKLEHEALNNNHHALMQTNREIENDKIALVATQTSMTKQLQDKQDRVDELHLLTEQAQKNLEHYREAAREQRILDEQRYQQTQLQLEQTIVQINQELMRAKQEKGILHQQNQQVNFEKNSLETQMDKLNTEYSSMSAQLTESLNEIVKKAHAEKHWQEQHNVLNIKWNEQNKLFLELQTQYALSLQEAKNIKSEAKEIAEHNKVLAHEKWILGQEKAQLYGQLKQLQEMQTLG